MMTSKDGRLTYEEFLSACTAFVQHQAAETDAWKLEGNPGQFGESFLSLCTLRRVELERSSTGPSFQSAVFAVADADIGTLASYDDEQNKRKQKNGQLLHYRLDIVYSVSHCVPVLYFIISETSGRLLSLDEIRGLPDFQVLASKTAAEGESLWNVVSLQDHPILHNPFYCVHPCNNWTLMKELLQPNGRERPITSLQFLVSWLSIVGNQFGLKLSPTYFCELIGS